MHTLSVIPVTGRIPDPFAHPASERVAARNDFKEQVTGMEVPVFGLSHGRVRTIGRGSWNNELQYVRVDVLVNSCGEGGRGASRG